MSFNIGLSGLNAASEEIKVVGNNIANASTTGFKSSRTEFGDVFAASVLGGGGQVAGGGVTLQKIAQNFGQGNINFTGNSLDLAINGSGFFVLRSDSGVAYTRNGAFGTDREGNVVNSSGEKLQGFAPTSNGAASGGGPLTDLRVSSGEVAPQSTRSVNSVINLDATAPPSSIVGSNLSTNRGASGAPQVGVLSARVAELSGTISAAGTDFSGTTPAMNTGAFNITSGLNFSSAGGNQGFSISVNGNPFQSIDLSGADTANETALIAHVQAQLNASLSAPNNVLVTTANNRLVITTAATGENANITIGNLVEGLAQNVVTAGTSSDGKTAPPTGFRIAYNGDSRDIVIRDDFTNAGSAALALGGGAGSGNEALEDAIQAQIDTSPSLFGKVSVSIESDGKISFRSLEFGENNLTIDPLISPPGSVNFNQVVSFETDRRAGTLAVDSLDFSSGATSFTITVGGVAQQIVLNRDYSTDGNSSEDLGDFPESGLEALEDEIQKQINASTLPGGVNVSVSASGALVFESTDSSETSLQVRSDSVPAQSIGASNISNGFNFNGGTGGTPYTFTIAYSVGGAATVTSNPIALTSTFSTATDLINGIQDAINTDANFQFGPGNEEVIARIDPTTGFLVIETADAGPQSQIAITVTAPTVLPTSPVIRDTTGLPGGMATGSGPAVDFNTIATFVGSELDNTGASRLTNGYQSEVIDVVDVANRVQKITVPIGATANEVAELFSAVNGVAATATTVAFITASNRGDPENLAPLLDDNVNGNLPLRFEINGFEFQSNEVSSAARLRDIAVQINAAPTNMSARIVKGANDLDVLEITENGGLNIVFSGNSGGAGSITVQSSVKNPETGVIEPSSNVDDRRQLANLGNLNQDAITIGGTVNFVLDEGVRLSDATAAADGTSIAATSSSIFGSLSDASALNGEPFELNRFNPDDPDTYYRSTALALFDSVGNQHTLTQYFVKERDLNGVNVNGGVWSVYFQIDGEDIGFDPANPDTPSLAKSTIIFDQNGRFAAQNDPIFITNWRPRDALGNLTNEALGPTPGLTTNLGGSASSNFEVDLSQMTQFGGNFSISANTQDGFAKGQLTGLDVDTQGIIFARYSNGQSEILGEVALADFADPSGLENIGGTRFAETAASGTATPSGAGTAGLGVIQSGALEGSNVELSDQLVQMIISQRNFQASAQIIEAIDATTQTILNL